MRYILDERYRLHGWRKLPTALYDTKKKRPMFFPKDRFLQLMYCDGAHELDETQLTEEEKKFIEVSASAGVIRRAGFAEFLKPEQSYRVFPGEYRRQAHWSLTGACNLQCRHCFMSAPNAKHGSPSLSQLLNIVDQLAECGVFQVALTGGEPLIRPDFLNVVDALNRREIGIDVIFTNGWLVDEILLDELDKRNVHPPFQLSFDGVGWHDFLRGVPGAEERTIRALKLLQEREHPVSVSMCMHRKNRHVLRESVRLLASLGVRSVKCGTMMELGEWAKPEMQELQLSDEEELEMFEEYIPQYFEDDAPVSIMLGGMFMYTPGESEWKIFNRKVCSAEEETRMPSCGVLQRTFYIGAEGMVCPCMGMADCSGAPHFPNLFETPLRDILGDSEFTRLCSATVGEVRDRSGKCRDCRFVDRCTGGCRNAALLAGDNYYGVDPDLCRFFENDGEARITAAAQEPFAAYIRRHPPAETSLRPVTDDAPDCP